MVEIVRTKSGVWRDFKHETFKIRLYWEDWETEMTFSYSEIKQLIELITYKITMKILTKNINYVPNNNPNNNYIISDI